MLRTLYSKLAVSLTLLFAFVGLLLVALMWRSFASYHEAVTQKVNRSLAEELAQHYLADTGSHGDLDAIRREFGRLMTAHPGIEAYLLDREGGIRAFQAPEGRVVRDRVDIAEVRRFLSGDEAYPVLGDDPRDPARRKPFSAVALSNAGGTAGYLYVILKGEQYDAVARELSVGHFLRQAMWLVAGHLAFALLAGLILFAALTGKLRRLSGAMEAFRQGGFRERIFAPAQAGGEDEIDRLADTYNRIVERVVSQLAELQQIDGKRRELIANVSHDLRTPVASLRGYLETLMLKYDTASPEELRNYLEVATRQSERLAALVAELFDLAKLEAKDAEARPEAFPFADLAYDLAQKLEVAARAKGVRLAVDVPSDLPFVEADIGMIERVLQNLIENAIRHTPGGGEVRIAARAHDGAVAVDVADTGCGIPEEDLPRIFERFYRVDKSRGGGTGGAGLGLAIAKRILDLHASPVRVSSRVGEGTTFSFRLAPAAAG